MRCLFSLTFPLLALFPAIWLAAYNEEDLDFFEEQIPELAVMALKMAYQEALASGSCVLIVKDGMLVEVSPDGSEKTIKKLPNWIPVTPGKYMRISIETEESIN